MNSTELEILKKANLILKRINYEDLTEEDTKKIEQLRESFVMGLSGQICPNCGGSGRV